MVGETGPWGGSHESWLAEMSIQPAKYVQANVFLPHGPGMGLQVPCMGSRKNLAVFRLAGVRSGSSCGVLLHTRCHRGEVSCECKEESHQCTRVALKKKYILFTICF